MNSYHLRQLSINDLSAYKSLRLEALQKEGGKFGNSYSTELAYSEDEWIDLAVRDVSETHPELQIMRICNPHTLHKKSPIDIQAMNGAIALKASSSSFSSDTKILL